MYRSTDDKPSAIRQLLVPWGFQHMRLWSAKVLTALGSVVLVAAMIVVVGPAVSASAHCDFGATWTSPSTTKHLTMYSSNIPSARRSAINSANAAYNGTPGSSLNIGATVYATVLSQYTSAPLKLTIASPGSPYMPSNTPAVTWRGGWTLPFPVGGNKATVYLNPTWTWTTHFDQSNKKADTKTVVLHELGHAHGLAHPWDSYYCADGGSMNSSELVSVMNADFTLKRTLRSDDLNGLNALY